MPIAGALSAFKTSVAQCDNLIASAHKPDAAGIPHFSRIDREQITIAAFLNMFIAWETFLEEIIAHLMAGAPTISGVAPVKYISPTSSVAAKTMVIGISRYFDYANHDNVRKIAHLYFDKGRPLEPHISAIFSELADLKTMRNSCAHLSSTTQTALESLAQRIFGAPKSGISLYQLLTSVDPRSATKETVFLAYKNKLIVTAELISQG